MVEKDENNDNELSFRCQRCQKVLSKEELKTGTFFCFSCNDKKLLDKMGKEMINHPEHYGGDTAYECIKVLKAWNTKEEFIAFCKNNAIKYLCRLGKKDDELQELKKALWYLQEAVKYLEEIKN